MTSMDNEPTTEMDVDHVRRISSTTPSHVSRSLEGHGRQLNRLDAVLIFSFLIIYFSLFNKRSMSVFFF